MRAQGGKTGPPPGGSPSPPPARAHLRAVSRSHPPTELFWRPTPPRKGAGTGFLKSRGNGLGFPQILRTFLLSYQIFLTLWRFTSPPPPPCPRFCFPQFTVGRLRVFFLLDFLICGTSFGPNKNHQQFSFFLKRSQILKIQPDAPKVIDVWLLGAI